MKAPWKTSQLAILAMVASSIQASAQDTTKERILALERAWNQAVQLRDGKAVEPLLGNELIYIDYDGTVMNKGQYMASVKSSVLHAEQVTNEAMKVRVYGATAVVVGVYREKGTRRGKAYLHRERFVDTWLSREGAWLCVASQSTLITH
jgi:ketosteroid isomerase-like protein